MVLEREEQMRKYYLSGNEKYHARFYEDIESNPHDYFGFLIETREQVIKHIKMNPHLVEEFDITITHTPDPFTIPIEEFMEEEVA